MVEAPTPWSTAEVPTKRADRYIKQLIDHFGRNRRVDHSPTASRIEFDGATCRLRTSPVGILIEVMGNDAASCAIAERIVASHLARFGSRDGLVVAFVPAARA